MKIVSGIAVSALLLAGVARPQQAVEKPATEAEKGWVTRVFEIQHHDVGTIAPVISQFGVRLSHSPKLRALAVTGPPQLVESVGEAIRRLDVPSPNVELTAYLLVATPRAEESGSIPPELEKIAAELKKLFRYQYLGVLDTIVVRVAQGGDAKALTVTSPLMRIPGLVLPPSRLTLEAFNVMVSSRGERRVIRVQQLRLNGVVSFPSSASIADPQRSVAPLSLSQENVGFHTNLDIPEGQKVIVGKANVGTAENALILVLAARVLD
ncbi:MAG TPA: secretin N-terminal domain-containing protein [Bryobacteraceae bacterium]|nr:secretin N-terminal domain-containing protein [Bryobacteraceae bacterium]